MWHVEPRRPLIGDLRAALRDRPVFGLWSTLSGVSAVGAATGAGLDFLVFDLQHGAVTEETLPASCAAAERVGAVPLVRARSAGFADVGRALDLGAHGVIVPSILGAEHAREVLGALRYPPHGSRSSGRMIGGTDDPLRVLMVETRQALAEVEQILALDGLDGIYVGPTDLALALGGRSALRGPEVSRAIDSVLAACLAAGMPCGVHPADGAAARGYRERGARIVTVAADAAVLSAAIRVSLDAARQPD
jgi:4-hydroxy-2-oxoheptanedioate aldolase